MKTSLVCRGMKALALVLVPLATLAALAFFAHMSRAGVAAIPPGERDGGQLSIQWPAVLPSAGVRAQSAGIPASRSEGIYRLDEFIDVCPQEDPAWATIYSDFKIRINGVDAGVPVCTSPVSAMDPTTYSQALILWQAVRTSYYIDAGTSDYQPWTHVPFYEWVTSKIKGINVKTMPAGVFGSCCEQRNDGLYINFKTFPADDVQYLYNWPEIEGLYSSIAHERRHADPGEPGHVSCFNGSCDPGYYEYNLGAYGVAWWIGKQELIGNLNFGLRCMYASNIDALVDPFVKSMNDFGNKSFTEPKPPKLTKPANPLGPCDGPRLPQPFVYPSITPTPTPSPSPSPTPTVSPTPSVFFFSNFRWRTFNAPERACPESDPIPPGGVFGKGLCVLFDMTIATGKYDFRIVWKRDGITISDAVFKGYPLTSGSSMGALYPPIYGATYSIEFFVGDFSLGSSEITVAGQPPPTLIPTASPTTTEPAGLTGDVDCDGLINAADLRAILGHLAGSGDSLACLSNADVDGDGEVTLMDAFMVLQYMGGLITSFPSGVRTFIAPLASRRTSPSHWSRA